MFTSVFGCNKFSFNTSGTKARAYNYAINMTQLFINISLGELFGLHIFNLQFMIIVGGSLRE
ncbi:hypothetical protein SDC9_151858 [bioreactor metagenome]|uniref:Uncharacterized protein n=1 Tax=bioreactor metagenome TaxID=1076179 RepID=A0A645EVW2_9ZZZZ